MKTQISRHSDQPARHYTGVYQQQGRMLVDADANELMEIVKRRQAEAVSDIVDAGAPRGRGVIDFTKTPPRLAYGHVYVDGLFTRLARGSGSSQDVYLNQADFPSPPPRPTTAHKLYVDLWERPVLALEDPEFADPALHGADTCTRTVAMAQLKWCPPAVDPLAPDVNPRSGNAELLVELRQGGAASSDPCDACAVEIDTADRIGNYVFRLEVHHVDGPPLNPDRIVLKWSSENGAESYPADALPPTFTGDEWIYEHYDNEAERHLGVHLAPGFAPRRGLLAAGVDATSAPFVRRWDGALALERQGSTWKLASGPIRQPGHPNATLEAVDRGFALSSTAPSGQVGGVELGSHLKANLGRLALDLELQGRRFVAGDHWLVTVRERAEDERRARVVTPTPLGIVHHVLVLGEADGPDGVTVDPSRRRRLSFPSLTDLTADSVGFKAPDIDLLRNAGTVQEALDRLQTLEAADVAFSDPECTSGLMKDASTVEEALEALCGLNAGHVGYDPSAAALPLTGAETVKAALDILGEQVKSDSSVCDAVLALFGRGVLSGLVPTVTRIGTGSAIRLHASCTEGTFINGRGCLASTGVLTKETILSTYVDQWLYIVDLPGEVPTLEFRPAPPVPLFDVANSAAIVDALVKPALGPEVSTAWDGVTASTEVWRLYHHIPPVPRLDDGAVCLGRVGFAGLAWIGPDDREQLFPTPALTTTYWRAQRKPAHAALLAAYTAGPPTVAALERAGGTTALHGTSALADGRKYDGVVRLLGPARGGPVTVELVGSGVTVPASVSVAAGQSTVNFEYSLPPTASGARTIDAKVGGQIQQHAEILPVVFAPLSVAAHPLAGVDTSLTIALTAPAPHAVQIAVTAGSQFTLTPQGPVNLAQGQQSASLTVKAAPGASAAQNITATVGQLTTTTSVTPRALLPLVRASDNQPLANSKVFTTGSSLTARVELTGPAAVAASLTLDSGAGLVVPPSKTIAAGATSVDFEITPQTGTVLLGLYPVRVHLAGHTREAQVELARYELNKDVVDDIGGGGKPIEKPGEGPGKFRDGPPHRADAVIEPGPQPAAGCERAFITPDQRPDLRTPGSDVGGRG